VPAAIAAAKGKKKCNQSRHGDSDGKRTTFHNRIIKLND
jgi:hypothetical protein